MAWRIDFEGEVYREVDLTLGEIEQMEDLAGCTWHQLAPLRSAKHLRCILAVHIANRKAISLDEAQAHVRAARADSLIEAVSIDDLEEQLDLPVEYEDGNPKAAAGLSTPT